MIRSALFSIGFRPFFASGILFSAIALFIWGAFWQLDAQSTVTTNLNPFGGFLFWHPHELIMGFALAIIMGFLLTATRNWTGLETAPPLGLLVLWLLWLVARFIMILGADLSFYIILAIQISVPLLAAMFIARPIILKRMWRNIFAPSILVLFAAFDAAILYQVQENGAIPSQLLQACIFLIAILITMIGGRIIPLFTANKLGIKNNTESTPTFVASLLPLIALLIASLLPKHEIISVTTYGCAAILFIAHSQRLKIWYHPGIWQHPMLWSLWGFYATLPLGFLVISISPLIDPWTQIESVALHVLAIGAICGLILSMVTRVSMGHTGRVITHDKIIVSAFILLFISMLLRTLMVAILGLNTQLITISAAIAGFSFLLIFCRFIYIWLTPRPDGK